MPRNRVESNTITRVEKSVQKAQVRGVLFDFDGTLTLPGALEFPALKKALGCPPDEPVLEFIAGLSSPHAQEAAYEALDRFEAEAAARSQPNEGAGELISFLKTRNIPAGIVSRNRRAAILTALENFPDINPADFKVIVSRDDPVGPKPGPEGVLLAAETMGVPVEDVLSVGDFHFDVEAGHRAGAITVYLTNEAPLASPLRYEPDYVIDRLEELHEILRYLLPLPDGKLPADLLRRFLEEDPHRDPSVVLGPAIGEDVAAVALEPGAEILVLKSDPITFTTDRPGHYALAVNTNDVATCGAEPRWFLATLLFPSGSTPARIHALFRELQQASREFGITLGGGHTEITSAVNRPVVSGHLVGTVARHDLIDKRRMARGDQLLFTKAAAVEGTAILAREFPAALKSLGMSSEGVERCQKFLDDPGLSILEEARLARRNRGVSAMHDVTEGGLATALEELSVAGGHGLRVLAEEIPVFPETDKLCRLLGISPLGLIGSGSLLIACRPEVSGRLLRDIREAGVQVSRIGEVLDEGWGVEAVNHRGRPVDWPRFETDEITRAFRKLENAASSGRGPGPTRQKRPD